MAISPVTYSVNLHVICGYHASVPKKWTTTAVDPEKQGG
jgi:hypothetical protein